MRRETFPGETAVVRAAARAAAWLLKSPTARTLGLRRVLAPALLTIVSRPFVRVLQRGSVRDIQTMRGAVSRFPTGNAIVNAIDEVTHHDIPAFVLMRDSAPWRLRP